MLCNWDVLCWDVLRSTSQHKKPQFKYINGAIAKYSFEITHLQQNEDVIKQNLYVIVLK